jgi:hypothetical protein
MTFEEQMMQVYVNREHGTGVEMTRNSDGSVNEVAYLPPTVSEPEMVGLQNAGGDGQVDLMEFSKGIIDTAAYSLKGVTQSFLGAGGDVEHLARGLMYAASPNQDEGRWDAFLRGLGQENILPFPDTEKMREVFDKYLPISPVSEMAAQPALEGSGGVNPIEYMAEFGAPGGQIKATAKAAKGVKKAGAALAEYAAGQVENMLDKQGLILKFGPDTKVQIPTAPKIETPEFQNWFGESKVLDAESKPLLMYHGTNKGGDEGVEFFDTYSGQHGLFGQGSYFTDNADVASSYTKKGKGKNPAVYPVYLSIKNPIDMDAAADPSVWLKAFPDGQDYFPESGSNEKFYRAMEEFYMDEGYSAAEAPGAMMETLMEMGYDGVTHIGGGRVAQDGVKHRVYIAFEPEQVKSVFNKGTFDPSDPRMLYGGAGAAAVAGATQSNDKEQN